MNKATLANLEKKRKAAEDQIVIRDETFDSRSKDWKQSEKASRHNDKTNVLIEYEKELDYAIDTLKRYLEL